MTLSNVNLNTVTKFDLISHRFGTKEESVVDLSISFIKDDARRGKKAGETIDLTMINESTTLPPIGEGQRINFTFMRLNCRPLLAIDEAHPSKIRSHYNSLDLPDDSDFTKYTGNQRTFVITSIKSVAYDFCAWEKEAIEDPLSSVFPIVLIRIIKAYHGKASVKEWKP